VATVFAREIRPGREPDYEAWLDGIARASSAFPGSHGTTILRPGEGRPEYIAISHFDSQDGLDRWLASDERARWLEGLDAIDVCRERVLSLAGMERWFTLSGDGAPGMPARYKTAALVLLGLYPTVLVLNAVLGPLLADLPGPLRVLVSLVVSVATMVWFVLPWLTRVFAGWLQPRTKR
jgi:antibiotic biosynthesis monooxygenase (ABM) superfamily enzyme